MKRTTPSQEHAARKFRAVLEQHLGEGRYRKVIARFETEQTEYGVMWVRAEVEPGPDVSKDSVLRVLDHEYWLVSVGRGGGMTVRMCPCSYEQFEGKRAFGMLFQTKV